LADFEMPAVLAVASNTTAIGLIINPAKPFLVPLNNPITPSFFASSMGCNTSPDIPSENPEIKD
jgi:hypothetical protein